MSYILNYSARYFCLYLWFAFVMCIIVGIPWRIVASLIGWDASPDALYNGSCVNQEIGSGILFIVSLGVFSTACQWGLDKTINHDYQSFKMSHASGKIKFSTALVFQLQVVASSLTVRYIPILFGVEISEIFKILLDLLVLFIANYIIVIRWIKRNTTVTPKDFGSSS